MARTLDDLGAYLAAQSTVFTLGTTLHLGRLPDIPSTTVALIEVLGFEPPAETFGASGSFNWERPQIQVVSRAGRNAYQKARNNIETAYKTLRSVYDNTTGINGTKYHMIQIRSSPYYQGEDENSRHMFSFTCDVWKDPSS